MLFKDYLMEASKVKLDAKTISAIKKDWIKGKYFLWSETLHKWDNDIEKLKQFVRKDLEENYPGVEKEREEKERIEKQLKNYTPLLTQLWDKKLFPVFDDYRKAAGRFVKYWDMHRHFDDGSGFKG